MEDDRSLPEGEIDISPSASSVSPGNDIGFQSQQTTSKASEKKKLEEEFRIQPVEHVNDLPGKQFRNILRFCPVWELNSLRLVCRHWNNEIVKGTEYAQQSVILLTPERCQRESSSLPATFDAFDQNLRSLRCLRMNPKNIRNNLSPTFAARLVHLDLFHCGPFTWPAFLDLLGLCHSLEEIRVRKCAFKSPCDADEWRIKYEEWQGQILQSGNRFPNFKALEFRVKDPHDVLTMIKFVSEHSTRLQRLSYTCRTPPQGLKTNSSMEDVDERSGPVSELFDAIVQTVNKFANILERFHSYLIDPVRPSNHSKSRTSLSRPLRTIISQFCSSVLQRLDWQSLKLRSFCLYGGELAGDQIPKETNILRDFLKSQDNLEKAILPRMKFSSQKEFEGLLLCIPQTVKCIRVPVFGRMPGCVSFDFHRLREYYVETHGSPDLQAIIPSGTAMPNIKTFSFYNCSDWIWQTVKITTIINSFPCLTALLIRDDGTHQCTRLGDSDVQNICRCLPTLKKLHMTNVDCVTDFGFTGILEKECKLMNESGTFVPSQGTRVGFSISALKDLEYLFLSDIGGRVTNVSLIHGFVFQNLRFMNLEGYPKVTPWGMESLKNNNAKLKRWSIDFHDRHISQFVGRLQSAVSYAGTTTASQSHPSAPDLNGNE